MKAWFITGIITITIGFLYIYLFLGGIVIKSLNIFSQTIIVIITILMSAYHIQKFSEKNALKFKWITPFIASLYTLMIFFLSSFLLYWIFSIIGFFLNFKIEEIGFLSLMLFFLIVSIIVNFLFSLIITIKLKSKKQVQK